MSRLTVAAVALLLCLGRTSTLQAQAWSLWIGRTQSWVQMRNPGCPAPCSDPTDFSIGAVRNSVALGVRIPFRQSDAFLLSWGVGVSERGWAEGARSEPTLYVTVPFTIEMGGRLRPASRVGLAVGGGAEANLPVAHEDLHASLLARGTLRLYRADGRIWELGLEHTQSVRGTGRYESLASTTVFFAIPLGVARPR